MGTPAVTGATDLEVDEAAGELRIRDRYTVREGEWVTIDGAPGDRLRRPGAAAAARSARDAYLERGAVVGRRVPHDEACAPTPTRPTTPAGHASSARRASACAAPSTCSSARIGSRTSSAMIMAETRDGPAWRRSTSCAGSRARTSSASSRRWTGLPVTIRLLDPPLHEFLPDYTELRIRMVARRSAGIPDEEAAEQLPQVERLQEVNPMLGTRGCRLGIEIPDLYRMQVRAVVLTAACVVKNADDGRADRGDHDPAGRLRGRAAAGCASTFSTSRTRCSPRNGHHGRVPRRHDDRAAARGAGRRRDRAPGRLLLVRDQRPHPDDAGVLAATTSRRSSSATTWPRASCAVDPFEYDRSRRGRQARQDGGEGGREVKPNIKLGVCGEHGGDPESIHFFGSIGLDYVSCSPFRVPDGAHRRRPGRAAVPRRLAGRGPCRPDRARSARWSSCRGQLGRGGGHDLIGDRVANSLPSSTPHWSNESIPQTPPWVNTLCSYSATSGPSVRGVSGSARITFVGRLPAITLCGTSAAGRALGARPPRRVLPNASASAWAKTFAISRSWWLAERRWAGAAKPIEVGRDSLVPWCISW